MKQALIDYHLREAQWNTDRAASLNKSMVPERKRLADLAQWHLDAADWIKFISTALGAGSIDPTEHYTTAELEVPNADN